MRWMGGGLVPVLLAITIRPGFGEANGSYRHEGQAQGPRLASPHPPVPTESGVIAGFPPIKHHF